MRVTVVGASGLIGTKVVDVLKSEGHEVVAASRSSGVDVLTGAGLADGLAAADALIDVTNATSFEADAVMAFFTTAATNVTQAANSAGVGHYCVLSIVGVDGLPDSPYMRAKVAQERIVTESGVPYSIVRATQFAEFTDAIVESLTVGDEVRVPDALIQPIPADEVAAAVAHAAVAEPINEIVNIGGPMKITFEQVARDVLARKGDTKIVVVDPEARYFGAALEPRSLVTFADRRPRISADENERCGRLVGSTFGHTPWRMVATRLSRFRRRPSGQSHSSPWIQSAHPVVHPAETSMQSVCDRGPPLACMLPIVSRGRAFPPL